MVSQVTKSLKDLRNQKLVKKLSQFDRILYCLGPEGPERLFSDLLGISGLKGPNDSVDRGGFLKDSQGWDPWWLSLQYQGDRFIHWLACEHNW